MYQDYRSNMGSPIDTIKAMILEMYKVSAKSTNSSIEISKDLASVSIKEPHPEEQA